MLDLMSQLRGADASVPVAAPPYPSHPITSTFRMLTAFPYARQVKPVESASNGRTATTFVQSGAQQLGGDRPQAAHHRRPGAAGPRQGGHAGPGFAGGGRVGAGRQHAPARAGSRAADQSKPETRLVVVGDSDFATNSTSASAGNRDLFLNIVNWLAQQENLISVRPRDPQERRITLSAGQDRFIFWLTVLIIPGLILLGGVQTWWRRR